MSLIPPLENETLAVSKFIDFDKNENIFYDNVYLDEYRLVVKIPLLKKEKDIKIKEFTLGGYVFLFSYEWKN